MNKNRELQQEIKNRKADATEKPEFEKLTYISSLSFNQLQIRTSLWHVS